MKRDLIRCIDYDFCVKALLNYCNDANICIKELSYRLNIDYHTLRKFLSVGPVNGRDIFKIISFVIELKGGVIFYEDLENY